MSHSGGVFLSYKRRMKISNSGGTSHLGEMSTSYKQLPSPYFAMVLMLSEEMRSLNHERLMINQITLNEHWFCLKIVHATVKS